MTADFLMTPPMGLKIDPELRATLLDYFVDTALTQELSGWLRDIGQNPNGSINEKRARVRQCTAYLGMRPESFPQQTIYYLDVFSSEHLGDICEVLGIDEGGGKDAKWRRIMREVGFREGWLPQLARSPTQPCSALNIELVRPFIEWHLIVKRGRYEKDFYPGFFDELEEIFGAQHVHEQLAIAHGTTLKIDFHIGHPQREGEGVGVEFKMPANNSDIQRALGQMGQYKIRYGERLLVVLFRDYLDNAQVELFIDQLAKNGIAVIPK